MTCPYMMAEIDCIVEDYLFSDASWGLMESPEYGLQHTNHLESMMNVMRCYRPKGRKLCPAYNRALELHGLCEIQALHLREHTGELWLWRSLAFELFEEAVHLPHGSLVARAEYELMEKKALIERHRRNVREKKKSVKKARQKAAKERRRAQGSLAGAGKEPSLTDYSGRGAAAASAAAAAWGAAQAQTPEEKIAAEQRMKLAEQRLEVGKMLKTELHAVLKEHGTPSKGKVAELRPLVEKVLVAKLEADANGVVVRAAPRLPRKCGFCQQRGHSKSKCPLQRLALARRDADVLLAAAAKSGGH